MENTLTSQNHGVEIAGSAALVGVALVLYFALSHGFADYFETMSNTPSHAANAVR